MKTDIYQTVTDQIIASLEGGALPWLKGWENAQPVTLGVPYNRQSKASYNGVNTLLLWSAKQDNRFTSDAWLTYKQAQALGGNVRKGSKGTKIVFFKPMEKETKEGKKERFAIARGYTVFNMDQVDGVEALEPVEPPQPVSDSIMLDVASELGCDLRIQGDRACFIPSVDQVHMPHKDQFKTADHFDATLAHELIHWTGAKARLDRDMRGRFGDESYAAEELIAEMGAAFCSAELGFNLEEMRHAGYIESWLKVLRNDKRAIFTAASAAQKACNWIKDELLTEAAQAA